jgi:hypothetical protein
MVSKYPQTNDFTVPVKFQKKKKKKKKKNNNNNNNNSAKSFRTDITFIWMSLSVSRWELYRKASEG